MLGGRNLSLFALTVAFALAPAAAQAQEDGVTVDPGSPSAKEYALPIEKARREASSGRSKQRSGGASGAAEVPPLFGEGVGGASPSLASNARKRGGEGEPGGTPATETPTTPKRSGDTDRIVAASVQPSGGGSRSTLLFVGGGAFVLLLGAGAGLALKRSSAA